MLAFASTLFSCQSDSSKEKDPKSQIPGQWMILYPDHHQIRTESEREVYNREVQDSLISLFGLKTIAFHSNGEFREGDSILKPPAKWMVKEQGDFLIDGGGEGFRKFRGQFEGIRNDTMTISENIPVKGESVHIVWYFKRLDDKTAKYFFSLPGNWWREKPAAPENDAALTKRVKAMLDYYAVYYSTVSKESAYFLQNRVPLPFNYYQHSMMLKPFKEDGLFSRFFYNNDDARKAYGILEMAMAKVEGRSFPSGKDFVVEYAMFMERLAEELK